MAEYIVQEESLVAIADKIREKAGSSESLSFPDGFVDAVEGISAGSGGGKTTEASVTTGLPDTIGLFKQDIFVSTKTGLTLTDVSDLKFNRYRLTITDFSRNGSRNQTYANIAEFALYDSEGNNLARLSGASYSANNYYDSSNAPAKAFDGDLTTNWHSNWNVSNTTNYLSVYIPTDVSVVSFGLTPHNEGTNLDVPVNFTLSASCNGEAWFDIAVYSDLTSGWNKGVERLFTIN